MCSARIEKNIKRATAGTVPFTYKVYPLLQQTDYIIKGEAANENDKVGNF